MEESTLAKEERMTNDTVLSQADSSSPTHRGNDGATVGGAVVQSSLPVLAVSRDWVELLEGRGSAALNAVLPDYLRGRRWFGGKARTVRSVDLHDAVAVPAGSAAYLALIRVNYADGDPDTYALPLAAAVGEQADRLLRETPHFAIARLAGSAAGVLLDATGDPTFCRALLDAMTCSARLRGRSGELVAAGTPALDAARTEAGDRLEPVVNKAEQSNTSIVYGRRMILKLFRRLHEGINPDLEIPRFLTGRCPIDQVPALLGALEYRGDGQRESMTLAVLQAFVPDARDGWSFTLESLREYFERVPRPPHGVEPVSSSTESLLRLAVDDLPGTAHEIIGPYLDSARLLGQRTGQLHKALASDPNDPAFAPEPFSPNDRHAMAESLSAITDRTLAALQRQLAELPADLRADAQTLLNSTDRIRQRCEAVRHGRITAMRIRCHGDYHLGQVLYTGTDFVILDFEGEPLRPLRERRMKYCPVRDVAGMLRSFHYAVYAAVFDRAGGASASGTRPIELAELERWGRFWYAWVSVAFLRSYLAETREARLLPGTHDELKLLCDALLLEKAIYELAYELGHRPTWVRIPLRGILQLLE